jgi:hypothetical protein
LLTRRTFLSGSAAAIASPGVATALTPKQEQLRQVFLRALGQIQKTVSTNSLIPPEGYLEALTSLQRDVAAGRRLRFDSVPGTAARIEGVDVVVNETYLGKLDADEWEDIFAHEIGHLTPAQMKDRAASKSRTDHLNVVANLPPAQLDKALDDAKTQKDIMGAVAESTFHEVEIIPFELRYRQAHAVRLGVDPIEQEKTRSTRAKANGLAGMAERYDANSKLMARPSLRALQLWQLNQSESDNGGLLKKVAQKQKKVRVEDKVQWYNWALNVLRTEGPQRPIR